jgi:hypothetical protein
MMKYHDKATLQNNLEIFRAMDRLGFSGEVIDACPTRHGSGHSIAAKSLRRMGGAGEGFFGFHVSRARTSGR